jgi:hypothetical protein
MAISKKAAGAYELFKKGKKIRTYGKLIKEGIDENTRPGALMKIGIRGLLDVAGKVLGTSLTSHPYFTYHKAHLEVLAQALNATSTRDGALAALNRAVQSADAVEGLTKVLSDYEFRKSGLKLTYAAFIAGSLNLLNEHGENPEAAARQMKDAGQTPESLRATTDQSIYEWRAMWCELYVDSVQLLAMGQVELRATEGAMQQFDDKMKAMSEGGSIGKIAAYSVEQDRLWKQFDRMTDRGTGSAAAVEDPSGFARSQVGKIERASDALADACEIVMSPDAYRAALLVARLGSR